MGRGTGTQAGPPTREKQRPAGSEVGAPAKPAPRSQKEHPPEAENKFRCFWEILGIVLLAPGGPIGIAQVGCLGQRPFCVQRDPVLKGRRLVNFANPWLLRRSGFQGCGCLSRGPWHCYYLGQRSPLGFPDLPPLQCEAPGWGGDARKSHRYLGGSELGLGTRTQTGPPTREKQRPAGSEVGAPAKPAPRSPKEHPPEAEK